MNILDFILGICFVVFIFCTVLVGSVLIVRLRTGYYQPRPTQAEIEARHRAYNALPKVRGRRLDGTEYFREEHGTEAHHSPEGAKKRANRTLLPATGRGRGGEAHAD